MRIQSYKNSIKHIPPIRILINIRNSWNGRNYMSSMLLLSIKETNSSLVSEHKRMQFISSSMIFFSFKKVFQMKNIINLSFWCLKKKSYYVLFLNEGETLNLLHCVVLVQK